MGRSGHFRCGDSLDFSSLPLTGRNGRLPSACAKLRGTVEIVDPDKGKTLCDVWFVILHTFVMDAHLSGVFVEPSGASSVPVAFSGWRAKATEYRLGVNH